MSKASVFDPVQKKAQEPAKGAAEGTAAAPLLKIRPFAEAKKKVGSGEKRDLFEEYVQRRAMAAATEGGGALGSGAKGGGVNRKGMPDGLEAVWHLPVEAGSSSLTGTLIQRAPFNQYIANLLPQVYYYIKIDGKDVIAQYLGMDDTSGMPQYWFNDLGRGDRAQWSWEQPRSQSRFYLLGANKEDISAVESPQQYLSNLGFTDFDVDWKAMLATAKPYLNWGYEPVTYASIKWGPVSGWVDVKKRKDHIHLFPALELDQIVESSTAYSKENSVCFLLGPDQTDGYGFDGDINSIITLLALQYKHLNQAAAPRSGKARAAGDIEEGQMRQRAIDEAVYGQPTKAMDTFTGEAKIDNNTSINIASDSTGSRVGVVHKGPWKKGDRGSGQSSAMGGQNAKNYVVDQLENHDSKPKNTLRQELGGRHEWLHVVGSSLGGINVKENLVAGSYDANTKMIALEHRVARWGTRDYTGEHAPSPLNPIVVVGETETEPNTRIGKSIKLTVSHGNKEVATGIYDVKNQEVITKSQYEAEEKRVDDEIKAKT